jgi:hypothetical protein
MMKLDAGQLKKTKKAQKEEEILRIVAEEDEANEQAGNEQTGNAQESALAENTNDNTGDNG